MNTKVNIIDKEQANELRVLLVRLWAIELSVPESQIPLDRELTYLGADSMKSIIVYSGLISAGFDVPAQQYAMARSINDVIDISAAQQADSLGETKELMSTRSLLPSQAWFLQENFTNPNRFNVGLVYECETNICLQSLKASLGIIVNQFPSLRQRFFEVDDVWHTEVETMDVQGEILIHKDLRSVSHQQVEEQYVLACDELHQLIDIRQGILFKALLVSMPNGFKDRLVIIAHHLSCDGYSLQILRNDIWRIYSDLQDDRPVKLPEHTEAEAKFFTMLQRRNFSDANGSQAYLRDLDFPSLSVATSAPIDNKVKHTQIVRAEYELAGLVGGKEMTTPLDFPLLASLCEVLAKDLAVVPITVLRVETGRSFLMKNFGIDTSRLVGWLAMTPPVIILNEQMVSRNSALERLYANLPSIFENGPLYDLAHFIQGDSRFPSIPDEQKVVFNFLGNLDSVVESESKWVKRVHLPYGEAYGNDNDRACMFFVMAYISMGNLILEWQYNPQQYDRSQIEDLLNSTMGLMRSR